MLVAEMHRCFSPPGGAGDTTPRQLSPPRTPRTPKTPKTPRTPRTPRTPPRQVRRQNSLLPEQSLLRPPVTLYQALCSRSFEKLKKAIASEADVSCAMVWSNAGLEPVLVAACQMRVPMPMLDLLLSSGARAEETGDSGVDAIGVVLGEKSCLSINEDLCESQTPHFWNPANVPLLYDCGVKIAAMTDLVADARQRQKRETEMWCRDAARCFSRYGINIYARPGAVETALAAGRYQLAECLEVQRDLNSFRIVLEGVRRSRVETIRKPPEERTRRPYDLGEDAFSQVVKFLVPA